MRPVLATQALHAPNDVRTATPLRQRVNDRGPLRGAVVSSVDGALQALLGAYVPVSLLITPQRQLLHAWGATERFLRMPGGQPNLDAIRMLPPRLGAVVGHAMQRSLRERQPYRPPPLLLEQDNERLQRLIDSLPQHIAVLDERGTITQVNLAWQRFARQNGAASGTPQAASTGLGVNYLGVLARSTDPNARELLTAVQALLAGQRPEVRAIYPCHSSARSAGS